MSGTKRKLAELGGHVVTAAVGDVVARTMSAAVGRYEASASVDDQLDRLGMLLIMVHSAVEAAEGVHIRSWWLRRWLWTLRDAALDADEVLRQSLRQRRCREGGTKEAASTDTDDSLQASGNWLWKAARRVFRSAKKMLFAGDSSSVRRRLRDAVARLEKVTTGLPEFIKLLDMEICRSLPPLAVPEFTCFRLRPSSTRRRRRRRHEDDALEDQSPTGRHKNPIKQEILHGVLDVPPRCRSTTLGLGRQDVCRSDDDDDDDESETYFRPAGAAAAAGGARAMAGAKRKVAEQELGGHVISAAFSGVVGRAMSAAVGRYDEARASVDEQLERLHTLSMMVHSAVEVAEGVHIRSWWLRRWLWKLRDAALDADEVLRLFRPRRRRRRADEDAAAAAAGARSRNTLWHALQSAKNLISGHTHTYDDDDGVERLGRMVARLEREAMRLGDLLKVLELEIRRSLPPPAQSDSRSRPSISIFVQTAATVSDSDRQSCLRDKHDLCYISHEGYVAGVRKMGLLIVRQRTRRALNMLIRKPVAPPPAAASSSCPLDTAKLRDMVLSIELAVASSSHVTTSAELPAGGERCWLALWRGELQAVADRARRVLLAVPVAVGDDDARGDSAAGVVTTTPCDAAGDEDALMRKRTARIVETAQAHLDDFSRLAWFAQALLRRP